MKYLVSGDKVHTEFVALLDTDQPTLELARAAIKTQPDGVYHIYEYLRAGYGQAHDGRAGEAD